MASSPENALGDLLAPGRAAFNSGAYWDAHELWEGVWRTRTDDARTFVQGLIQIAAGLHHAQQGRPRPAARLIERGLEKLARGAAGAPVELDVAPLVSALAPLVAAAEGQVAAPLDPSTLAL